MRVFDNVNYVIAAAIICSGLLGYMIGRGKHEDD